MNVLLTQFASTEAGASDGGIFGALGIDLTMLIVQGIAFLILVWVLGKFVYPVFLKSVDERQAKIEEGSKAAAAAEKKASEAQEEVAKLLSEARKEAGFIVATAKEEANAAVEAADAKAKARAEKIVANATETIEKEVIAAKKALHNETIDLVAQATEKVLGHVVTDKVDEKVIAAAIKEVN
ncbi:TPA: ATP synthase F0 subunit B [Candidatus Saccharibacteria bacterium]|nr:MAG: ATP synthase subunit b [Candidatus Saccharibacteria bacterium GW2011_GWC2_44_17]MBH1956409.1 F0F1 ATP synthase subunit B [Candidatus Saccharibacteria bacterium]OGL23266.1 MAG: ATP synthase F0 subunit B [Candidatus Saccharibacteria bacterium RIFCSPHIGHO2_01_FULL_46_30]OGL33105.1 MAG: ATP synthase F0 subunit B [Candidatus Saccharibacteria bacterium RIFCSPHIGHO2_12_FULL_47_16]MBH1972797.1 F0F1 ATP synthase subunit B [Candidatus Saccharibacteria bacterium]